MFGNKKQLTDIETIKKAFDRREGGLGRRLQDNAFLDKDTGVFPGVDEVAKILSSRQCRIYLGIDPTGPDIHLGHTISLLFLKQLLSLGHRPVLVIGDFTARIGDPTSKESARKPLTEKEVKDNMKNYVSQVEKILPKGSFDVEYNSSWLSKMSFGDVLGLASHVTVQQFIQRDMFQKRLENSQHIGLDEFLYPLMQGYDSVAMKIDGEVGGNDQTFNMLVGRDLEKKLTKKEKMVFATQLLVDSTTGKKMSKSEGGIISLSDSPADMFGRVMKVPDGFILGMFKLCTEIEMKLVNEWEKDVKEGGNPKDFKSKLAYEIVRMYHGEKEAAKAKQEFQRVFSEGSTPEDIKEYSIQRGESIVDIMMGSGLVSSKTEAKRLIDQKAVEINHEIISEWKYEPKSGDVIKVGPRKFIKIK